MASMPPINDWLNVAAVRSELPVNRPEAFYSVHGSEKRYSNQSIVFRN
jgi:hypothetical protein